MNCCPLMSLPLVSTLPVFFCVDHPNRCQPTNGNQLPATSDGEEGALVQEAMSIVRSLAVPADRVQTFRLARKRTVHSNYGTTHRCVKGRI